MHVTKVSLVIRDTIVYSIQTVTETMAVCRRCIHSKVCILVIMYTGILKHSAKGVFVTV